MNYPPQAPQQPPPRKQGMSTGMVVLIVGGCLLFMGLSTCGVLAFEGYSKYREVATELAEGGVPDASPPQVVAELSGAKKDYVGDWKSASGKSTFQILPDGNASLHAHEKTADEKFEGVIAAFKGNDIELDAVIHFTLKVRTPPHKVGDKFEIVVNDITFDRPATP